LLDGLHLLADAFFCFGSLTIDREMWAGQLHAEATGQ
jgi:hypothetical protein